MNPSHQYGSRHILGEKNNMENIKSIIYIFYLGLLLTIVFFNWIYSARVVKATRDIGLYTPKYIKILLRVSNGIAVATAALIGFFMVAHIG